MSDQESASGDKVVWLFGPPKPAPAAAPATVETNPHQIVVHGVTPSELFIGASTRDNKSHKLIKNRIVAVVTNPDPNFASLVVYVANPNLSDSVRFVHSTEPVEAITAALAKSYRYKGHNFDHGARFVKIDQPFFQGWFRASSITRLREAPDADWTYLRLRELEDANVHGLPRGHEIKIQMHIDEATKLSDDHKESKPIILSASKWALFGKVMLGKLIPGRSRGGRYPAYRELMFRLRKG